jgi:hypothetical protein
MFVECKDGTRDFAMGVYLDHYALIGRQNHYQPINIPIVGAQAFLMDHTLGERAMIHHAGPERIGWC